MPFLDVFSLPNMGIMVQSSLKHKRQMPLTSEISISSPIVSKLHRAQGKESCKQHYGSSHHVHHDTSLAFGNRLLACFCSALIIVPFRLLSSSILSSLLLQKIRAFWWYFPQTPICLFFINCVQRMLEFLFQKYYVVMLKTQFHTSIEFHRSLALWAGRLNQYPLDHKKWWGGEIVEDGSVSINFYASIPLWTLYQLIVIINVLSNNAPELYNGNSKHRRTQKYYAYTMLIMSWTRMDILTNPTTLEGGKIKFLYCTATLNIDSSW